MRAKLTSLLMMLCLLMVFAAVVQAAPAGKVTNLEGRADLTAPGQPAKALFIGDAVNVGDILRTKSASKLEVTWIDGSIARLSENSRLKVTEYSLGARKRSTILSLFRGKVQNIVTGTTKLFGTKDGSKYEVHTPTSVCGVRGTIFFTYHENGVSGALFTEGQGFMYSKGQPGAVKPVAPGIMMIVTSANKPPEAKPAKPGDATKLFNATNPSEKKKDDKKGEDKKEGATGGGTSGTGGTTTMLGGDPTATLETAPPGTLAAQIESGTTADSPGTSSPLTNPTTPVSPVVVPVVEPTPTETATKIDQTVAQGTIDGTLKGSISDTTNTGTLNLTGTGMESIYVVPTTGTLSDGSTDNAYLAGIPGSWRGLFIGLSRKSTSVSLLSGTFPSGAYTDQTLNAAGSIARAAGSSIGTESQYQSFTDLPLLVLQNVSIGQAFSDPVIYGPSSGDITTDGIMGYNTLAGGILGIWGAQTLNGAYVNATGETSKNIYLYHYKYDQDPSDHFAFGGAVITDDLQGHTTVKSSALLPYTYLDRHYLGTLSLDYQGVYDFLPETPPTAGVSYSSIGTGIYNLQPLAWSGNWGSNEYRYIAYSLYGNAYDTEEQRSYIELVAHEMGLAGGVTPFWSQTSRMTALGYIVDDSGATVMGETVNGPLLWNSGIAAQALTGATVGDIFTPDAEFTGITAGVWKDGLMKGSAYAIYKTAAGQAGWLIGKDTISGLYDSEIGMWKAEGDLTPTPKFAALYPELTADLEVFHDIAFGIAGGSFGGQGSIGNQSSTLQTTFYGKRISVYDEEYQEYVEKILPLRWGIYDILTQVNDFSGKPAGNSSWTAKIGGVGPTQMGAPFYYLADITGTWAADETISGQLSGRYMTPLYKGILSGPFYGLYNIGGTDETGEYGGWIGQSVGTYNVNVAQKLAHSASWGGSTIFGYYQEEGAIFTDAAGEMGETGGAAGMLGGLSAPWNGSTSFDAMGLFRVSDNTGDMRGTYLWNALLQGSVPKEVNEAPTAGGIYAGYSAALWRKDNFTGAIRTIYLTPPDVSTGKSTAGFLAGSNLTGTVYTLNQGTEYNEYVKADYSYADGLWEATGTMTASTPLATGLDPASITSSYGEMDGKFSGSFAGGAGVLSNDTYYGDLMFFMNGSTPLPFGVYDLKLGGDPNGGAFSGKPAGATAWTANLGGYLSLMGNDDSYYDHGFWIAGTSGQWSAEGEITGNINDGKYLTTMQSGILSGPFYGLYTEQGTDENGLYGTWVGQSVGNYEGKNLTFVSDIYPSLLYYDGSGWPRWQNDSYNISGLLGGTDSLWASTASTPAPLSAMGMVSLDGTPASTSHIFNATTASHNYKDIEQVNTTYDGGAYYLFYGGSELNKKIAANLAGLYIYDGKAGLLHGSLSGDVNSDIGIWEASGSLYKEEKGSTTIAANELQNNLWGGTMTGILSSEDRNLSGSTQFAYTGTQALYDKNGGTNWIMNGGIWQANFGGSYSGTIPSPWTAKAGGLGTFGPYRYPLDFGDDAGYWLADITDGTAAGNSLSAGISGWYLTEYTMGTLTGNFLGTYGTSGNLWQGAAVGTFGDKQVLAYSAHASGGWGSYNTTPGSEGWVRDDYGMIGKIGGVSSLFSGTADINGMGSYCRSEDSSLFTVRISNSYPYAGPEENPFHIYYGGSRVAADEYYPEWFEGKMAGFYARNWDGTKYNEIGLITSGPLIDEYGKDSGFSVWGDLYPYINHSEGNLWAIPSDEDQGTLTHTAKTGTVSSFSVYESDWSPVAKVDGDFQGTMRMKSAHLDGIEDWGIWMSAAGGSAPETIPERWASTTGWKETNAGKSSYSIADVDGYAYSDGTLWAGVNGRFLNPDNMGIFTGDLVGIVGNDTWQAMGLGGFNVTRPLAFSSGISGDIYKTAKGTLNINSYMMPGAYGYMAFDHGVEFETVYFRSDSDLYGQYVKYGWQREAARSPVQKTSFTYYSNNTYQRFTVSSGVPIETVGATKSLPSWPDFYASPSSSPIVQTQGFDILTNDFPYSGTLPVDPASKQFAKVFSQTVENFYATTRLIPDISNPLAKTFQGIMGGYVKDDDPDKATRTLWNATDQPMGLALMGEHAAFDGPAAMASGIESSYNGSATTPDGGAYYGFLINQVSADRTTRGMFHGLYISPAGNAGFLQSTDIEGGSYAGLDMWEAEGDITSRQVLSGIGVAPADLLKKDIYGNYENLMIGTMSGNVEYGGTSGNFVSGGSIRKLAMDSGYTVSIKGYPCNGIFLTGGSGGTYTNPGSAATWQADSSGYAIFGYPGISYIFPDYGIWRMNVDKAESIWADNEIYATVTGEFLSYTKQGTLTGTFLGNYTETNAAAHSGIWGGNTSGVYEKTRPTAFSSGLNGQVFQNKLVKWISGNSQTESSYTSYYIFGDPANFPAEKMNVHKMTGQSGIVTETKYDYQGYTDDANPIAYTKTTWQYSIGEGGVAENMTLLESKTISNNNYLAEVEAMRSGVTEYTGYGLDEDKFQGVFAGFGNLWNNMAGNQPTEIALAGLYDVWNVKTPGIFTAGITSFNPAVNMNPFINSTSQIGGAYFARLGGAFGTKTVPYDTMEGLLSGLYYKDGTVGLLYGTWTGSNWTDIAYLKGSGAIDGGYALGTGVSEGDFALTSANFASKIMPISSSSLSFDEGSVTVLSGDNVVLRSAEESLWLVNPSYLSTGGLWGIEQKLAAGTKAAGLAPTAWAWEIPAQNITEYGGYKITSTSNGISTGSYLGTRTEPGLTMIEAGSIKGLFDPNATTWQAVSQGAFMETNTFVTKVASLDAAGKEAFMNATKIPAIEVGKATLTQASGTVNNLSNVTMNNVGFYAYSTGVAPKIWATNSVGGSYSGTPSTSGPAVPLSGGGLNANFNVNQWNGSTWSANVAGSGNLSGGSYTGAVQFTGGAAGAIQPAAGTFSGTGAGLAK